MHARSTENGAETDKNLSRLPTNGSLQAYRRRFLRILLARLQSSVFKLSKDLIDSIHEEGIVAYTS